MPSTSCWTDHRASSLSSSSATTVYLTQSRLKQLFDQVLCREWIAAHRLPLFIRSELFSEYKLLKMLSNSASSFFDKYVQQTRSKVSVIQQGSNEGGVGGCVSSGSRPQSRTRRKLSSVPTSIRTQFVTSARRSSARSRSVHSARRSKEQKQLLDIENKVRAMKSKFGMDAFRKFLSGKLGEKSLVFWIDIEGLKSKDNKTDFMSELKNLRSKYPNVPELKDALSPRIQTCQERLGILDETHSSYLQTLKEYWYPRFLISVFTEPTSQLSLPSLKLSSLNSNSNHWFVTEPRQEACYHHPSLKPHTPTFRKMSRTKSVDHQNTGHSNAIQRTNSTPQFPMMRHIKSVGGLRVDHHCQQQQSTKPKWNDGEEGRSGGSVCRLVWSRESVVTRSGRRTVANDPSMERSSRLATYNRYPLIPCGRTSTMSCIPAAETRPVTPVHPPSCPQILSVSGTPVPLNQYSQTRADYKKLLNCLSLEKRKAGGYFQKHLELSADKTNTNCLFFWREVQEYKCLFLQWSFSIVAVEMKAKVIYGKYVCQGSPESIACPDNISTAIFERIWPAFEDLFNEAEEHALSVLLVQWRELCAVEQQLFDNLQHSEENNEYSRMSCVELEKLSEECSESYGSLDSIESDYMMDEFDQEGEEEGAEQSTPSSQFLLQSAHRSNQTNSGLQFEEDGMIQEDREVKKEMAFSEVLNNPRELEYFKMYLNDNGGAIHLLCWMEIEGFRAIPASDKVVRNIKAKQIRSKYFTKQYFFGPHSPANKELQRQIVSTGGSHKLPSRPKSAVFREAQKYIRLKIEKFVRSFVRTSEFLERNDLKEASNKDGESKGGDSNNVENDLQSNTAYIESHETILMRRVLGSERERRVFQQFMNAQAAEGTSLPGKQVDFWLEVQRYKEMFHSHMSTQLLKDKMQAIILCYFQSQTPPRVQIDVSFSIAEETTKKKFGPYVFRESQAVVFRNLQSHWSAYQDFVQNLGNTPAEAAIDKLREEVASERSKMKEEMEHLRMEEERTKMSVPRFETIEEKKIRLRHEKELEEFGEVAVSFRLSQMNQAQFTHFLEESGTTQQNYNEPLNNNNSSLIKRTVHSDKEASVGKNKNRRAHFSILPPTAT